MKLEKPIPDIIFKFRDHVLNSRAMRVWKKVLHPTLFRFQLHCVESESYQRRTNSITYELFETNNTPFFTCVTLSADPNCLHHYTEQPEELQFTLVFTFRLFSKRMRSLWTKNFIHMDWWVIISFFGLMRASSSHVCDIRGQRENIGERDTSPTKVN